MQVSSQLSLSGRFKDAANGTSASKDGSISPLATRPLRKTSSLETVPHPRSRDVRPLEAAELRIRELEAQVASLQREAAAAKKLVVAAAAKEAVRIQEHNALAQEYSEEIARLEKRLAVIERINAEDMESQICRLEQRLAQVEGQTEVYRYDDDEYN